MNFANIRKSIEQHIKAAEGVIAKQQKDLKTLKAGLRALQAVRPPKADKPERISKRRKHGKSGHRAKCAYKPCSRGFIRHKTDNYYCSTKCSHAARRDGYELLVPGRAVRGKATSPKAPESGVEQRVNTALAELKQRKAKPVVLIPGDPLTASH